MTDEDEIHINKRTKLEDPSDQEILFDIKKQPKFQNVDGLLIWETKSLVNTSGRITGPQETIQSKGKTLKKQEAVLTDNTGSICLVLWEGDRKKIISGCSYNLRNVAVKTYPDVKYATLNAKSSVEIADAIIDREDEIAVEFNLHSVFCPADEVKSINKYLSCYKYPAIIVHIPGKKLIKCSECGPGQLRSK
jgi:hypothetical protein